MSLFDHLYAGFTPEALKAEASRLRAKLKARGAELREASKPRAAFLEKSGNNLEAKLDDVQARLSAATVPEAPSADDLAAAAARIHELEKLLAAATKKPAEPAAKPPVS